MNILKIFIFLILLVLSGYWLTSQPAFAGFDPLSRENNRMGVHILDPSELERAAVMVNGDDGEWGYVVVPMRANDRDKAKWEAFFRKAGELKVIPIVRLATFAYGPAWEEPSDNELLYFAYFLDDMPWPIENRYVIIFNEPNHALEWGGEINPETYADRLYQAIQVFKRVNDDFFVLPAALDRAAPESGGTSAADGYWDRVFDHQPELVEMIDGWNAHAYPNPGFSGKPTDTHEMSIRSYQYELAEMQKRGREDLPVFITEVGWSRVGHSDETIAEFWQTAWNEVWTGDEIVSVNAWLLHAADGPFEAFSLLDQNWQPTPIYDSLMGLSRTKGDPLVINYPDSSTLISSSTSVSNQNKSDTKRLSQWSALETWWNELLGWLLGSQGTGDQLTINGSVLTVEIADEWQEQQLGLGYRDTLAADEGMLFVYKQAATHGFWMKGMRFPLDMIWINDGVVVDITRNVPVADDPEHPTASYAPSEPANWVLEVNAGWAAQHEVEIGDRVSLE